MTGSRIEDIHRYIAAFSLMVTKTNGTEMTIPAYCLDELPNTVSAPPCRLILPYSPRQSGTSLVATTFGGGNQERLWQVCDMFLFASAGQDGRGVKDVVIPLLRYQTAYMKRLRTAYTFGGSDINATITDTKDEITMVNYPAGSSDYFHGVEVILTVHELIG